MRLIFIYGMPAAGKFTVARALAALTGFKLFHNHLTVDLLLSVFDFGSPPFVALREEIWLSVFAQACRSGMPGLIFTFNPETTVRSRFVEDVRRVMAENGGEISFVELTCPLAELRARMNSPSRHEHGKLTALPLFDELHAAGTFDTAHMPKPAVSIDTSLCSPGQSAGRIAQALGLDPVRPEAMPPH
jgi:hypothetical protein